MDESTEQLAEIDRLTQQFADADKLLREAVVRLDRLGEARNQSESVVAGLTTLAESTNDFVRAAADATRALGEAIDLAQRTLNTSRALFDGGRFDAIDERLTAVDARVAALRDTEVLELKAKQLALETRVREYESVMSGRQRRRAQSRLSSGSADSRA